MKQTPEEKAREILIKMQFQSQPLMFEQAKKCALIAVDEIISNRQRIKDIDKLYWQQVKQEIEKL
jgi:hypothetical protein